MDRIENIGYGEDLPYDVIRLTEFLRDGVPEVGFIESTLGGLSGRRCLELCSGTGRLAVRLAEGGGDVWAIDGSRTMMRFMRKRIDALKSPLGDRLHVTRGDICLVPYPPQMDIVILADGALGYLLDACSMESVLRKCSHSLKREGVLLAHLFNPQVRRRRDRADQGVWTCSVYGDNSGLAVVQRRRTTAEAGGILKTEYWETFIADGVTVRETSRVMRYRLPKSEEVLERAQHFGFRLTATYGGFDMSPVGEGLDTILVMKRDP